MNATSAKLHEDLFSALHRVPSASGYCIALSGGRDSMALLDACHRVGLSPLYAIHVHHGLNPDADDWAAFCQAECDARNIELKSCVVQVQPDGEGIEAAARRARYACFERVLDTDECLLLAHHADDQLETRLMRMFKGGQPEELIGMPQQRSLGKGWLFRPWLGIPRSALESYVRYFGVRWVEDTSNRDPVFDRNFIRHAVLPVLMQRWPDLMARLEGLAGRQQAVICAAGMAERQWLASCPPGQPLELAAWSTLEPPLRPRFLQAWLIRETGKRLPASQLRQVVSELEEGCQVNMRLGRFSLRSYQGRLYTVTDSRSPRYRDVTERPLSLLPGQNGSLIFPTGTLHWHWTDGEADIPQSQTGTWSCRYRCPGDKAVFDAHTSPRPVREWFQQQHIPEWERDARPFILHQGTLMFWGDQRIARLERKAVASPGGWCLSWCPNQAPEQY